MVNAMHLELDKVDPSKDSKGIGPFFIPIHQIIEKHALETPNSLAVRYNHHELSYSQLNKAANRLAHHLKTLDIGFEDRVIVCMRPSFNSLIALLGILKAGAVYVPLDPNYPIARIQSIFTKIDPMVVISEKNTLSHVDFDENKIIHLDELPDSLPDDDPINRLLYSQTAYIFNTSGSTGAPKSVVASHSNLLHFMEAAIERFGMDKSTVMPALARFSFSISLFELLCPLVAGGTVLILDREQVLDPAHMAKTLSEVTMFHAGPSLLKGILSYIKTHCSNFKDFEGVKHASSGGDMVPPEVLETLKECFPKAEVFVIYGATELACMGCSYFVPRDRTITKTYVGQPFTNTTLRLIDENFNQVSMGIEGEVCFAGSGITHGYLDQPELTEDRFCIIDEQRFYRTGDLGRLSDNKELELLGRLDFQIKIRGMRVELAEVEYQLRLAPGVKDAVVAAHDLGSGEKTLMAYVVLLDKEIKDIAAIHKHLAKQLPEYMLPICYAFLDNLPLNFNLKLDRKALPDPSTLHLHRVTGGAMRTPLIPLEKNLAAIWSQLLNINEIGLDDNFFDLGGHSLLAIELVQSIKTAFGVSLDAMEVLRESFEVQALIIAERLGQQIPVEKTVSSDKLPSSSVESFYFGPDSSLYGVLYKPNMKVHKTLLICGPSSSECELSLFIIQQLARRLSERGIAVFQFHYYGLGDSVGLQAIENLTRWCEDIISAHSELKAHYPETPTIGLGIRIGATLLWDVKEQLQLNGLVLWEPIFDGPLYLKELNEAHQKNLDELNYYRHYRLPQKITGTTELLGTTYMDNALSQLQEYRIRPSESDTTPVHWIMAENTAHRLENHPSMGPKCSISTPINWYVPFKKLPDTGLSKLLAQAVERL